MGEWLRLGPLGWRFVAAFLIVGLASIGGLLIATALELDHRDALAATAQRQGMIDRLARETGAEFARTGDWQDIDLSRPVAVAESNDAHFVAVDASDTVVIGGPVGSDFRDRAVSAPVLVDGRRVGQVYVVFYSDEAVTAPQLGASWFLAAGTIAALAAIVTAIIVTRLLTRPLIDLSDAAASFADGDREARAATEAPGELGQLGRAFNEMADQVTSSEQARRRVSADIAHELRTPLTVLQAGLEELRDGLVPADPSTLSALHDQAVRLGRVVNDLSELAHAESPSLLLSRERLDLADLASDALLVWRPRIDDAEMTLETSLQMGTMVSVDADRMSQVVTNLISNAVRYSSVGDRITVTVRGEGDHAVLSVADTGPGIPADDIPHVLARSYRGTDQQTTPGSGIGLAVVSALVQAHGGDVHITSQVGKGTTVTVRVPRAQ